MEAPGEDDIQIIQVNGLPFRKPKALPRVISNPETRSKIGSAIKPQSDKSTYWLFISYGFMFNKKSSINGNILFYFIFFGFLIFLPATNRDNDEIDCTITLESGEYVTKVIVPSIYYKFLIGKKGATKQVSSREPPSSTHYHHFY